MSREIDEKIVSMRLDNSNFEKNAQESMSTLDKLKEKLQFKKSTDGLDDVAKAAEKGEPSFNKMGNAVETVKAKLSAMQVIGITALTRIANKAITAGEQLIKSFTIDPIKTGLQEYETQIGSIQTILANTSAKGTTLDQVNGALDELNHYADKTIYNFTQMTKNIGTFTAAGVDLNTSVGAIKGIANLAAVSGSTATQASTAMYQLSQALATGTVKLQDWNSVVNAGMGGQVFQNALMRTAEAMRRTNREFTDITGQTKKYSDEIFGAGTNVKKLGDTGGQTIKDLIQGYGSFRESMTKGQWLTTEVLTETLNQFAGVESEINTATLKAKGYTDAEIKEIQKMAVTAEEAATKVRTATQLVDTLKEAAQSGWTQTWEYLLGDFNHATELFTSLSDFFSDILSKSADRRNAFVGDTMLSGWQKLQNKITETGASSEKYQAAVEKVAKKQGVDLDKLIEKYGSFEKSLKSGWLTPEIGSKALKSLAKEYDKLTDKQLAEQNMTRQQVEDLKTMAAVSTNAATSIGKLLSSVGEEGGWRIALDSLNNFLSGFKNIGNTIVSVFDTAFKGFFTSDDAVGILERIRNLSERFKNFFSETGKGAQFLQKVLTPVFTFIRARLDDLKAFFSGDGIGGKLLANLKSSLKDAFGYISTLLSGFKGFVTGKGSSIWEFFKSGGSAINDFLKKVDPRALIAIAGGLKLLIGRLKPKKKGGGILDYFKSMFGDIGGIFKNLKNVFGNFGDFLKTYEKKVKIKQILYIATSILMLAGALKLISTIPADKMAASVGVLSTVMAELVGIYASMTAISGNGNKPAKGILAMTVLLVEIGVLIWILTSVVKNPEAVVPICTGVAELLVAMGFVLFAISNLKPIPAGQLSKIIIMLSALTGIAVVLGLAVSAFANLAGENPWAAIPIVLGTSALLVAIAGVLAILSITPELKNPVKSLATFAVLSALAVAIGYFLVRWSNDIQNPEAVIVLANQISKLLIVLSGVCLAAAAIGTVAIPALKGIGVLAVLVAAIVGVIEAIGFAMEKIPGFEQNLIGFKRFMGLLGEAFGSFAGGFAEGFSSHMPDVGNNLSVFMENLKPFFSSLESIPENAEEKLKSFKKLLGALTGAEIKDALAKGIAGFFGVETNLGDFGLQLLQFSSRLKGVCSNMEGTNLSELEKISGIFQTLGSIKVDTGNGILSILFGRDDLNTFGDQLVDFAKQINKFAKETEDIKDVDHLKDIGLAMQRITKAAADIQSSGGLWGKIKGDSSLGGFGDDLKSFGKDLANFADNVKDIKVSSGSPIDNAVIALRKITNIKIPESGGFLSMFKADNDLSTFGGELEKLADGLSKFHNKATAIKSPTAADNAIAVMEKIINVQWPESGGLIGMIIGKGDGMGDFGKHLEDLADGVRKFAVSASYVKTPTQADNAVAVLNKLVGVQFPESGGLIGKLFGKDTMSSFATNLEDLGEGIESWTKSTKNADKTKSDEAVGALTGILSSFSNESYASGLAFINGEGFSTFVDKLKTMGENLKSLSNAGKDIDSTNIGNIKAALDELATVDFTKLDGITNIPDEIASKLSGSSSKMMRAGAQLANHVITGITSVFNGDIMTEKVNGIIFTIASAIEAAGAQLAVAGDQLGAGIETGLVNRTVSITSAATGVASAAVSGVLSKYNAMVDAGKRLDLGIMNGISKGRSSVQVSLATMLNAVINAGKKKAYSGGIEIGTRLIDGIVYGINRDRSRAATAAKNAVDHATNQSSEAYSKAYSGGSDVGKRIIDGFIVGMTGSVTGTSSSKLNTTISNVVTSAINAAKKAAGIESPSKKTMEMGAYMTEGFIIGLNADKQRLEDTSISLARSALTGLSNTLSSASATASYTPTISPVVNLSNAKRGLSSIRSGVLSQAQTVNADVVAATRSKVSIEFENAEAIQHLSDKIDTLANNRTSEEYLKTIADNSRKDIYLNGSTLVGELAPDIDSTLGRRLTQRKRYSH